ncbi:hypothetical protein LJC68_09250 [Bacteroidales bacterium OttesenSCG-928-B11]|nr:hypothetical protein [Bacteroidales bacterium OttesenSCG-928-E04]MDL2313047.1 hypothetical protein [Bacteroidales bacterium OttesenSCG-928-B11]MDL2326729.1 hypothetical protein [Bacteroidales bacterium OttesenSCG-928-A14]
MKRLLQIIPLVAIVTMIFLFTTCKKETDCKARVICRYTTTGLDTLDVVDSVLIVFGKETFAEFAQDSGITDANGVYETVFRYEALLDLNAFCTKKDSVDGEEIITDYIGKGEIKLVPGETVEKVLLMMPQ